VNYSAAPFAVAPSVELLVISMVFPFLDLGCGWSAFSDGLAAVDDHGLADDEGGCVRTQPQDGVGDFVWCSHPSDRFLRDHSVPALGGAANEPLHHLGVDDSRADGVDADV
jgi:hypothetical protein